MRLARLVKVESVVRNLSKRINSQTILVVAQLVQVVFGFLLLNHFIACVWCFIGRWTGDGWYEAAALPTLEVYFIALHWSLTQFHGSMEIHPGNTVERLFALITLTIGMLFFSAVISI